MADSISERKKTFKPKEVIKNEDHKTEMQHLVSSYEGSTDKLKTLTVIDGFSDVRWNRELLVSLESKEIVHIHPNQKDVGSGYVRIVHSSCKAVSIFSKVHFV